MHARASRLEEERPRSVEAHFFPRDLERLEALALHAGLSRNDALRQAISAMLALREHEAAGCKILLEDPTGAQREVIFHV